MISERDEKRKREEGKHWKKSKTVIYLCHRERQLDVLAINKVLKTTLPVHPATSDHLLILSWMHLAALLYGRSKINDGPNCLRLVRLSIPNTCALELIFSQSKTH